MGKIFYLMGKSSSGKDTIYKQLMADEDLHLKNIVLYTTRPIRQGEQEGIEYHFITEEQLANLEKEGRIIELRAYDTCFGIWKYCTVDAHIDLDRGKLSDHRNNRILLQKQKHFTEKKK